METLKSIVLLVIFGVIAKLVAVYLLNAGGLMGALLAGKPGRRSMRRFVTGSVIASLGQSFVYLAFTAFIVTWSLLEVRHSDVNFMVWPFAFFAVMWPIWHSVIRGRLESRESGIANAQVEGLQITVFLIFVGFVVFAMWPRIAMWMYGWVPYLGDQLAAVNN